MSDDTSTGVEVAVLGLGSAGLLTARALAGRFRSQGIAPNEVMAIGRSHGGSSVLSSWYVAQYQPEALRRRLIGGLGEQPTRTQTELVTYIAEHHIDETNRFKDEIVSNIDCGGVKQFVDGFSGIKALTGYSTVNALPGAEILRYLRADIEALGVVTRTANIADLERVPGGFRVELESRGRRSSVVARRLVIATGGMAHTKDIATSARADIANVLELAERRLGLRVLDLDRAVFFPFALREAGYRAGCLLPPSFMTRADIVVQWPDGTREDFLSDRLKQAIASGDYRPQFAELVALFNDLRARGAKVLVETRMTESEFDEYRRSDHYGYVFRDKSYDQALSLSIAPAYHSALGGICVDAECTTSDPNVFAVGESALVYGTDRPIGGEHVSAITLAPVAASSIATLVAAERCAVDPAPSARSLDAIRRLIDHHDRVVATNLEALYRSGSGGTAGDEQVRRFVGGLLERVAMSVESTAVEALLTAPKPSIDRVLATELDCDPGNLPGVEQVVGLLDSLAEADRQRMLEAVRARLTNAVVAAPIKQALGQSIRDPRREAAVVRRAVGYTDDEAAARWIEALQIRLVLPISFELQRIVRGQCIPSASDGEGESRALPH